MTSTSENSSNRFPFLYLLPIAIALIGGLAAGWFLEMPKAHDPVQATVLDTPRLLADVQLLDKEGAPFTRENFAGNWSMLFFGFTHCPDVCPGALLNFKVMRANLIADEVEPPTVIFISVDPERDTPEQLKAYTDYFDPAFKALTGPVAQLRALTDSIGVGFTKVAGKSGLANDYQMDHSAWILLLDENGHVRAYISPPHTPEMLANDYRVISGR